MPMYIFTELLQSRERNHHDEKKESRELYRDLHLESRVKKTVETREYNES